MAHGVQMVHRAPAGAGVLEEWILPCVPYPIVAARRIREVVVDDSVNPAADAGAPQVQDHSNKRIYLPMIVQVAAAFRFG